jgi:hypothetical protein
MRRLQENAMLPVTVLHDHVRVGERFCVTFQRTLRVPDDGRDYPLPPGLGAFPVHRVEDYGDRVPAAWRDEGGVFLPVYQREALWLGFDGTPWKPNAVKVGVGRVNAVSGGAWHEELHADPQDYLVCPDQPWLDGVKTATGVVRQFVAMPLGLGYTVEGQVTGREEFGGIQLVVFEPRPGRFPDRPPPAPPRPAGPLIQAMSSPAAMGLGAGGRLRQKVYPDRYGAETWDPDNRGRLHVHLLNSLQYREVTGRDPPPTPVSARTYTEYGLPWFELYDEDRADVPASDALARVRSVRQQDQERGLPAGAEEEPVDVPPEQVEKLGPGGPRTGGEPGPDPSGERRHR